MVDYTQQGRWIKLRKGLRYVRLYGPRRTLAKIHGQYHKNRRYDRFPALVTPPPAGGHVGFLGCGNFAFSTLAWFLRRQHGRVIRAAMDIDLHRAASLYDVYGLRYYTDDAERILGDPEIDLVFIASNHASHAGYAARALEAGKHVHIEKPHVVTRGQLVRLCRAMGESTAQVALGFNRPHAPLTRALRSHLDAESGPGMYNWSVFGHPLPADHWYAKPEEGGRVFGNLCHWTDFLYHLVEERQRYPIRIIPVRAATPDLDIAVSFVFGDGSIGSITFSAKGETFEGVRETFAAHRGDTMIWLRDFETLDVEIGMRRVRTRSFLRDPGHAERVRRSYALARPGPEGPAGASLRYVWETAELFIATDEALRGDRAVEVGPFDPRRLEEPAADGVRDVR